jgi:26S proteasome regulatory subunit N8
LEAEEVGVEHLLRDVRDTNISTLSTQIGEKVNSLKSLIARLEEMYEYLQDVIRGALPINHTILSQLQDVFNLLPNLNQQAMVKAFNIQTNDNMAVIYLASMIRSIITLHNLINNKLEFKRSEDLIDGNVTAASSSSSTDAKKEEKADDKKKDDKKAN